MTNDEAIAALNAIHPDRENYYDAEDGHADADQILLELVDPEVAKAYMQVTRRFPRWAYA